MDDFADECETQEHLSHEVHVQGARLCSCSDVVQFARVHVHVIVLVADVVCLMLVFSAHVVLVAVFVVFP